MTSAQPLANSEEAIFSRLIRPDRHDLSVEAAQAILGIEFEEADRRRMELLSEKARNGTLTRDEQGELNNFERVGHFLALMHSKARQSLKRARASK